MTALIDGPRLKAKSGAAKQLVVFLHRYGADGGSRHRYRIDKLAVHQFITSAGISAPQLVGLASGTRTPFFGDRL